MLSIVTCTVTAIKLVACVRKYAKCSGLIISPRNHIFINLEALYTLWLYVNGKKPCKTLEGYVFCQSVRIQLVYFSWNWCTCCNPSYFTKDG